MVPSVPRACAWRRMRRGVAYPELAAAPGRRVKICQGVPVTDDSPHDPAELLSIARLIAIEAGTLIVEGRAQAKVTGTKSAAVDIVTQMDTLAEAHIRQRLSQLRPDDAVLGEEGSDVNGTSGVTWIVDPIDGTVNYLYGLPHFAVSIAAVVGPPTPGGWTALAGAVFDGSETLWSAAKGLGAWRGEASLVRTEGPPLEGTLLGTGFQYVASRRAVQGQVVAHLLPQVRDIRRLGACSVDLCLVAAGELDAYYENGLHPWDYAAGELICSEAGVRVGGADGGPPTPGLLIAAVPRVWESLRDAIGAAGGHHPWDTPDA